MREVMEALAEEREKFLGSIALWTTRLTPNPVNGN